jgi:enoyl-CoA hydratase/carnithine racemase
MAYENYSCLKINVDRRVAFATIDHPPFNLMDMALIMDLDRFSREVQDDQDVRVVVFQSADPDFFIPHIDIGFVQSFPTELPPKPAELNPVYQMFERFRTMPKATVGKLAGIARGAGSEFLLSLDMCFAARGRAVLCQPEAAGGIITGGGGSQRLPRRIGRSRALEVLLGACDFDADTAERYGYINRALPPDELTPFVNKLAYRIATFPSHVIALMKASVDAAHLPVVDGLLEEAHYFNQSVVTKEARERLEEGLALGLQQSREKELINIADTVAEAHAEKG